MPESIGDWFIETLHADVRVATDVLLARLAAAFVLGCVAAGLYALTTRSRRVSGFAGTLLMLSLLIALVTLVIGNNVARAFGLAGVLAIVRFRTVVEETRDSAFVIFAVASGMACGAGYLAAPLATTPLMFLAAWWFRPRGQPAGRPAQRLILRLGSAGLAESEVQALLKKHLPQCRLMGLSTARGGSALDVTVRIAPLALDDALALVAELTRIEGVQGVELKE